MAANPERGHEDPAARHGRGAVGGRIDLGQALVDGIAHRIERHVAFIAVTHDLGRERDAHVAIGVLQRLHDLGRHAVRLVQHAARHDVRVQAPHQARRQRVQACHQFVGSGHAFDQAPRHHAVGAVAQQHVPALDQPVTGEQFADHRFHARRRERGLEHHDGDVAGRLVAQRAREPVQALEQRTVVRAEALAVGLDAHQDDVRVRGVRVIVRGREDPGLHRIAGDVVQRRLDAADHGLPPVDRANLPAGSGRIALQHHDARRLLGADPDAGMGEQCRHRHADDAGSHHGDLAQAPVVIVSATE